MCNRDWCANVYNKIRRGEFGINEWILLFSALFAIAMSISSFVTTVQSYSKLKEIEGDYNSHLIHWDALPLIDVELVNPGQNCPNGYEKGVGGEDRHSLDLLGVFPGTYVK